jgi:uncharacterized protein with HEPN domain
MWRDAASLFDMLDSARIVLEYVDNMTFTDFMSDQLSQDAVIRRLTIVGEAARQVSQESKDLHSDIPWRSILGFRNVIVHEYSRIDMEVVWTLIHERLPDLIAVLERVVPEQAPDGNG